MRYQSCHIALLALLFAVSSSAATLEFNRDLLVVAANSQEISYPGAESVPISNGLTIPVVRFVIALEPLENASPIRVSVISKAALPIDPATISLRDEKTSLESDSESSPSVSALLKSPVHMRGIERDNGTVLREIAVSLIQQDSLGNFVFVTAIDISVESRLLSPGDLQLTGSVNAGLSSSPGSMNSAPSATQSDYLLITSRDRVRHWQTLSHYRAQTGYQARVVAVEDILAIESGRDNAEKLRSYLQQYAVDGGQLVLLAGDESNLPVRYAYEFDASGEISLDKQQLCDLYFADLTGDWNADNDLVWGEPTQDQPDLAPELLVGRVPLTDSADIAAYIARLVRYETNPGNGDDAYLTSTAIVSADQMRDGPAGGQHGYIARAFPGWFEIDTTSAVEQMSGDDPFPTSSSGRQVETALQSGYGILQVLAHGRHDGFAVRTAGYNEFPKSYLWTGSESGDHGLLSRISAGGKPCFIYSLACETAGFDTEQPPFNYTNRHMSEELLGKEGGGVGIVGNSRWGWVNLSYRLQKSFFDSLFAHPDDPAILAMYRAQAVYPWYRDLLYNQVFLGDPALRVYTRQPSRLQVSATAFADSAVAVVARDGENVPDVIVTLSDSDSILQTGSTDAQGRVTFPFAPLTGRTYVVTTQAQGSCVAQKAIGFGIVTDVDDPPSGLLPDRVELYPSYPNPFNPSTTISFSLPRRMPVSLAIYNILGQRVTTLLDGALAAGEHKLVWDAGAAQNGELASGVYLARLETPQRTQVQKLLLAR